MAHPDQHDVRPGRFETRQWRSIPEAIDQIVRAHQLFGAWSLRQEPDRRMTTVHHTWKSSEALSDRPHPAAVITMDRGFGDIQRYPPGSHGGILVLLVDDQSAMAVVDTISRHVASTDLADLRKCVAVYRNGDLRVRRPSVG